MAWQHSHVTVYRSIFLPQTASITGERSIAAESLVAGDDNRDRILAVRIADRLTALRLPDRNRNVLIAGDLLVGNGD